MESLLGGMASKGCTRFVPWKIECLCLVPVISVVGSANFVGACFPWGKAGHTPALKARSYRNERLTASGGWSGRGGEGSGGLYSGRGAPTGGPTHEAMSKIMKARTFSCGDMLLPDVHPFG